MRTLLLGLVVFSLGLGAVGLIASPGAGARSLVDGTITGGVKEGSPSASLLSLSVTNVAPGTYEFDITDSATTHDFAICPGTSRCTAGNTLHKTDIEGTGSFVWDITLTAGTYTYQCDAHSVMTKHFTVGPTYAVAYNGNGATGGSAPVDGASPYTPGTTVTVLGAGSLTKTGYTFSGWNTAANASGTSYQPGGTFSMPAANVTLYAKWTVKPTSETVHCNQKLAIASPGKNLSGFWKSNVLGKYYVRQIGSCVSWIGLGTYSSQSQKYDYANAFFGTINSTGTTITGYWFNLNAGTNSLPYGSLKLHVVNATHLSKTAQTGGFGASSWTQQSSSAATFVSPSSSAAAIATLAWTCDPAAAAPSPNYLPSTIAIPASSGTTVRYNVRQIGSCLVFWGRPKVSPVPPTSPKWTYSNVFFGHSTGSGTSEIVKGPWENVPAGTRHLLGQLTLTVTGQHTFKASGTGGWTTTTFNHTP